MVYLENVTVRVSHRLPLRREAVRKDLRRPRFSFFRFNCQTAKCRPKLAIKTKKRRSDIGPTIHRGHDFRFEDEETTTIVAKRNAVVDVWLIRSLFRPVNPELEKLQKNVAQ